MKKYLFLLVACFSSTTVFNVSGTRVKLIDTSSVCEAANEAVERAGSNFYVGEKNRDKKLGNLKKLLADKICEALNSCFYEIANTNKIVDMCLEADDEYDYWMHSILTDVIPVAAEGLNLARNPKEEEIRQRVEQKMKDWMRVNEIFKDSGWLQICDRLINQCKIFLKDTINQIGRLSFSDAAVVDIPTETPEAIKNKEIEKYSRQIEDLESAISSPEVKNVYNEDEFNQIKQDLDTLKAMLRRIKIGFQPLNPADNVNIWNDVVSQLETINATKKSNDISKLVDLIKKWKNAAPIRRESLNTEIIEVSNVANLGEKSDLRKQIGDLIRGEAAYWRNKNIGVLISALKAKLPN